MPPDPSDDLEPEELLGRARAGDQEALGRLLDGYRNYLRVLTRLRLHQSLQGKVSGSDVIQEACLRAYQRFAQFRGQTEAELLGWLREILAGVLANTIRHYHTRQRDVRLEARLTEDLDASSQALGRAVPGRGSSPSERAARREQAVRLADALADLPEHYREVLLLRHVEGLSFPEVAEHMGRTQGSVEKLWARALARLRDVLGDER
jgi:RNA polymerase sigma-70 factor (ECF subfamily)